MNNENINPMYFISEMACNMVIYELEKQKQEKREKLE